MNQLGGFPLVTLILFLPALGAVATYFLPARRKEAWIWLTLLVSMAALIIALFIYMAWSDDPAGPVQFVDGPFDWLPSLGIQYHVGIDGLNLHLITIVLITTPLALLQLRSTGTREQATWILLLETAALCALTSLDLILFMTWCLIAAGCGLMVDHAPPKSTTLTDEHPWMVHGLALVIAAVLTLAITSELLAELGQASSLRAQTGMFWMLICVLGLVSGVFPLHNGYRMRAVRSSPGTQILILCQLGNLGIYGLIRFGLALFPLAAHRFAPVMIWIGVLGWLYGSLSMLGSTRLEKLVVWWHVAQTGLTISSLFLLNEPGLHGAMLNLIARSLNTTVLLLLAGDEQTQDEHSAVGAWTKGWAFLSTLGMPGLAGFAGLSTIVMGILGWQRQIVSQPAAREALKWALYLGWTAGGLLSTWAFIQYWIKSTRKHPALKPSRLLLAFLVLTLVVGLAHTTLSRAIGPTVSRIVKQFHLLVQTGMTDLQQSLWSYFAAQHLPGGPS